MKIPAIVLLVATLHGHKLTPIECQTNFKAMVELVKDANICPPCNYPGNIDEDGNYIVNWKLMCLKGKN